MAYIGQGIKQGTFKVLDTSGNTYNGSNTTFSLGTQVGSAAQLLVSHDGVIQKPGTDYTLATGGTQITFSTAPASGASIFITEISGAVGGTVTPSDTSVTADKLNTALLTGQTDIGADIADADLFLIDDGAGGTLRKTAASRIKTYAGGASTLNALTDVSMDITNFSSGLLIQPNSSGSAPTTGTLNSASFNIGIGKDVFKALTEGDDNVAIGTNAGQALTTGSDNLFVGRDCGYGITTGEKNLCIGATSMGNNDTESNNMAIGFSTLNAAINGGENNVAIGNYAGDAVTSGDSNTIVGWTAGSALTTGSDNTIIGEQAHSTLTTGSSCVAVGKGVNVSASGALRQIAIGHNVTTSANDQFRFGYGSSDAVYNQFATNASWTRASDERIKKDIKTNEDCGLDFINDLRTVTFKRRAPSELPEDFKDYDADNHETKHKEKLYGMIAQEVKAALDKHNITDFGGWHEDELTGQQGLSQEMFVYPLIKAIQELSAKVVELEKKLEDK
tara:strand:+ start:680 stop:2191 length:1512 start_codon:yes stop_codon:yes gene_type:complete